ncbi:MAG: hypothetical protein HND52_06815 [Ignavibacteriae bacterium]|nr:hypothetical protein [Ignavibacteriota bacterium]NOG97654.1 hypothetical protein [Ignavibacteriota bacterium]
MLKIKQFFSIALITLFLFGSISAQTKISPAEYKSELDSLLTLKSELTEQKLKLKNEIENLSEKVTELERKLTLARRDLYITKYGKEAGENVALGRVWIGMTEDMLRDSWGKPDKIEKNVENWGVFTQWYYGDVTYFFRDGILTEGEEKE